MHLRDGVYITREEDLLFEIFSRPSLNDIHSIDIAFQKDTNYFGSIRFLDMSADNQQSICGISEGLLQTHFYPLGGDFESRPKELHNKGIARKIELAVIEELLKTHPTNTTITIGASDKEHIEYCIKAEIKPFDQMTLEMYRNRTLAYINK